MDFIPYKTPVEVLREAAFEVTYFRDISSKNNNCLRKAIINANNSVSKTTRNVILIFFCVGPFITFNAT